MIRKSGKKYYGTEKPIAFITNDTLKIDQNVLNEYGIKLKIVKGEEKNETNCKFVQCKRKDGGGVSTNVDDFSEIYIDGKPLNEIIKEKVNYPIMEVCKNEAVFWLNDFYEGKYTQKDIDDLTNILYDSSESWMDSETIQSIIKDYIKKKYDDIV